MYGYVFAFLANAATLATFSVVATIDGAHWNWPMITTATRWPQRAPLSLIYTLKLNYVLIAHLATAVGAQLLVLATKSDVAERIHTALITSAAVGISALLSGAVDTWAIYLITSYEFIAAYSDLDALSSIPSIIRIGAIAAPSGLSMYYSDESFTDGIGLYTFAVACVILLMLEVVPSVAFVPATITWAVYMICETNSPKNSLWLSIGVASALVVGGAVYKVYLFTRRK